MKRVCVIGIGYVGIVTASCFAKMGYHVLSLDIDPQKIASLKEGKAPIYEPGLEELIAENRERLIFTTSYEEALSFSSLIFLALPTPSLPDGSANLSYLEQAVEKIASLMQEDKVIVNKSTVPVGTASSLAAKMEKLLQRREGGFKAHFASNPEFLKEGEAISDFLFPDRLVVGAASEEVHSLLRTFYAPLNLPDAKYIATDLLSAEMSKYAANAMLASRISFVNEMALLCEKLGAEFKEVRKVLASDKRIGPYFLNAGVGYGGSCFPKDVRALLSLAEKVGMDSQLLSAIHQVNERQKRVMGEKIVHYFASRGGVMGKKIALFGLSFKPKTDDIRDAPSLTLIATLLQEGALLSLYDPIAMRAVKELYPPSFNVRYFSTKEEAASKAEAVVLMTEWEEFLRMDLPQLLHSMQGAAFFDGRNQFSAKKMKEIGFEYFDIGGCVVQENRLCPV